MEGADSSRDDLETDLLSLRDAGKGTDSCFTNPWRLQSPRESGGSKGVLRRQQGRQRRVYSKSKKNWARWIGETQSSVTGCCCPWSLHTDLSTSLLYKMEETSREACWDIVETHPDILLPWDSLPCSLELFFKQTADILPLKRSKYICLVWNTKLSLA